MRYLSIKNFDQYQHYKDWQPPWIKLYNRLLDDYAFLQLPEVSQRHLICLWLLASRHDNRIPNDLAYISRALHAKSEVDLGELIAAGFVEPTNAGPVLKRRKRNKLGRYRKSRHTLERVKKKSTPETETETETETEKKNPAKRGKPRGFPWMGDVRGVVGRVVGGSPKGHFYAKDLAPLVDEHGIEQVCAELEAHLSGLSGMQYFSITKFVGGFGTWAESRKPKLVGVGGADLTPAELKAVGWKFA